jgi:hypothetical protein
MKTYIAIIIGIVVLFAVVFVGYKVIGKKSTTEVKEEMVTRTAQVTGEVKRVFEGDHVLSYSFVIPEMSSTTVEMDGGLVKVVGATGTEATVYFSYEGGRGYSPFDYLTEVVAPHVAVIDPTGTTTVGAYVWTTAQSAGSEWFVAPTADSQWLIVVEAKKAFHDDTQRLIQSMSIK